MTRLRIVCFGASITQWSFEEETRGFGWALQQYYGATVEVCNEGIAGYTSEGLKPHFEDIVRVASRPNAPTILLLTILVGSNDSALFTPSVHVPLAKFSKNLRHYVDEILVSDAPALAKTKIVLIAIPPLAITKFKDPDSEEMVEHVKKTKMEGLSYKAYIAKKTYAEEIIKVAGEYVEVTDRVAGVNLWRAMVNAALIEDGRNPSDDDAYDVEKLPGCGLPGSTAFSKGFYTDGLHLGRKGYGVLTRELMALIMTRWPELTVERLREEENKTSVGTES